MNDVPGLEDGRVVAAIDMLGRTGAHSFQIRYSDDEEPTVWMATAEYRKDGASQWVAAAGMDPLGAVLRLCETVVDGGICRHCHRPTAFAEDFGGPMVLGELVCWYAWDPELKTFRRDCEGD